MNTAIPSPNVAPVVAPEIALQPVPTRTEQFLGNIAMRFEGMAARSAEKADHHGRLTQRLVAEAVPQDDAADVNRMVEQHIIGLYPETFPADDPYRFQLRNYYATQRQAGRDGLHASFANVHGQQPLPRTRKEKRQKDKLTRAAEKNHDARNKILEMRADTTDGSIVIEPKGLPSEHHIRDEIERDRYKNPHRTRKENKEAAAAIRKSPSKIISREQIRAINKVGKTSDKFERRVRKQLRSSRSISNRLRLAAGNAVAPVINGRQATPSESSELHRIAKDTREVDRKYNSKARSFNRAAKKANERRPDLSGQAASLQSLQSWLQYYTNLHPSPQRDEGIARLSQQINDIVTTQQQTVGRHQRTLKTVHKRGGKLNQAHYNREAKRAEYRNLQANPIRGKELDTLVREVTRQPERFLTP